MKKLKKCKSLTTLLLLALFSVSLAFAQSPKMPSASPKVKAQYHVGYTKISTEYSSPGVKARKIFGDLVSLDKIWRTGANKNSMVSFDKDVIIGDTEVKAGQYSLFTIPGTDEWTVILNSNTEQSGTGSYSEEKDVLRIKVKPQVIPKRERLLIYVSDFTDSEANLSVEWDTVKISVPIKTHTEKQAEKEIEKAIKSIGNTYMISARYYQGKDIKLDKALEYANLAIKHNSEIWHYYWTRANIHKKKGNIDVAKKDVEKAKELGENATNSFYSFYKERIEKALSSW